ncbi:hypothetical protein ABJY94_18185 [Vibrio parahaemolyticus]|uniref:hypothetical protein n=1 Tax=Vibrio parahaemolyticus TaxID=670 RepID=UPI0032AFAE09
MTKKTIRNYALSLVSDPETYRVGDFGKTKDISHASLYTLEESKSLSGKKYTPIKVPEPELSKIHHVCASDIPFLLNKLACFLLSDDSPIPFEIKRLRSKRDVPYLRLWNNESGSITISFFAKHQFLRIFTPDFRSDKQDAQRRYDVSTFAEAKDVVLNYHHDHKSR